MRKLTSSLFACGLFICFLCPLAVAAEPGDSLKSARPATDPGRDFEKIVSRQEISKGVDWLTIQSRYGGAFAASHALLVDLQHNQAAPALAGKHSKSWLETLSNMLLPWMQGNASPFSLATVSQIAQQNQALGAINGTYFSSSGHPLGICMVNYELISFPAHERTALIITENGQFFIDNLLAVQGNHKNQTTLNLVPYNDSITSPIQHLVGGGPRLVKKGKPYISKYAERFKPDIARGRKARSAVGITKGNQLLLVAVDGPQKRENGKPAFPESNSHQSRGANLEELTRLMLYLGAWDAMNLDGGGSTTLVVNNQPINRPSDGVPRKVSNAIIVKPK